MADIKISAAADAGTLVATDKVPLARSASTTAYSATMAEIATWANTQLPVASTTVSGTVKVDGTTITISSGTISSAAAPPASSSLPYMDGTPAPGVATSWSRGDHVHPSDTAKAPLASPTFTGTPAAPTPTTGDNSTKIATTAFVQAQMVASGAGVSTWNTRAGAVVLQQSDIVAVGALNDTGRNLLHNGRFEVSQRGAGPWTASGYTLDRWLLNINTDAVSISRINLTAPQQAAIGDESALYALQNVFAGNAAATAFELLTQPIENVYRLSAKTVTVSFYAMTPTGGGLKLGISLDQVMGTGGSPSANVNGNGQTVTVGAAFARYSLTFSMPSMSGKTVGTNGDHCTWMNFWCSAGSNFNTRSGTVGVQSGTIQLWGIQLEIGTVATPLAKREYAEELRLAQRYYQVIKTTTRGPASAAGQVFESTAVFHPMRAVPTIVAGAADGNANISAAAFSVVLNNSGRFSITSTAAGDAYGIGYIQMLSADL